MLMIVQPYTARVRCHRLSTAGRKNHEDLLGGTVITVTVAVPFPEHQQRGHVTATRPLSRRLLL
jgi:hypothetical protein